MCKITNKGIDECLIPIINALNNQGLQTVASCCGHGKQPGNIALADGREIVILPNHETARALETKNPDVWPGIDTSRSYHLEMDALMDVMYQNRHIGW